MTPVAKTVANDRMAMTGRSGAVPCGAAQASGVAENR